MDLLLPDGIVPKAFEILDTNSNQIPRNVIRDKNTLVVASVEDSVYLLVVTASPLKFDLYHEETLLVTVNERSLFYFEKTGKNKVSTRTSL